MATKNLTLLLFLFAFLFGCNDDVPVSKDDVPVLNKNEGKNTLEDHVINPDDVKRKNFAAARVNVLGGHLTLIIDSPVDAAGNVIIKPSGTTQVNFRVVIVRTAPSMQVQFRLTNSIQTNFWTSAVIRTLDFPNNEFQKTVSGSFNITAAGVNYGICLFVRDFLGAHDSTGDCKNLIIFVMPPPNNVFAHHDGNEDLTVTWNPVSGASEYWIYTYVNDGDGRPNEPRFYRTTTSTTYTRELKLQYRNSYRIWISARNSNGIESVLREATYSWK